jgi:hypothetical protein
MMLRAIRLAVFAAPLLTLIVATLAPGHVSGLPSFSRTYAVPCSRCHAAFSSLNTEGMKFLQDGYRMRDESGRRPEPRHFPLSIVADMNHAIMLRDSAHSGPADDKETVQEFRRGRIGLHVAGTLSNRLTFHVEGNLPSEDGAFVANTSFIQLDDLAKNGTLNLKAGEYIVEAPYLALTRPARLQEYLSPVSLPARGFEFNGAAGGWAYGAGLMNSGRSVIGEGLEKRWFGRLEDTYMWLIRDVCGQQIGARMLFDRQDSNLPSLSWMQHLQAQGTALLEMPRAEIVSAYTLDRFDDRPAAGIHQRHQTGLLEARVPLDEGRRWLLTARAEHEYTTRTVFSREEDHQLEAIELGFDVRPNAELALEWVHAGDNVAGPRVDHLNAYFRFGY